MNTNETSPLPLIDISCALALELRAMPPPAQRNRSALRHRGRLLAFLWDGSDVFFGLFRVRSRVFLAESTSPRFGVWYHVSPCTPFSLVSPASISRANGGSTVLTNAARRSPARRRFPGTSTARFLPPGGCPTRFSAATRNASSGSQGATGPFRALSTYRRSSFATSPSSCASKTATRSPLFS